LLPECLGRLPGEDNAVRVVIALVDELNLEELGFEGAQPAATGRPSHQIPAVLKVCQSTATSTKCSRELASGTRVQRNIELMWLTVAWLP